MKFYDIYLDNKSAFFVTKNIHLRHNLPIILVTFLQFELTSDLIDVTIIRDNNIWINSPTVKRTLYLNHQLVFKV